MALYRVSIKKSGFMDGEKVEKGMSVEVFSNLSPMNDRESKLKLVESFQRKYGIKVSTVLNMNFLEIVKEN